MVDVVNTNLQLLKMEVFLCVYCFDEQPPFLAKQKSRTLQELCGDIQFPKGLKLQTFWLSYILKNEIHLYIYIKYTFIFLNNLKV